MDAGEHECGMVLPLGMDADSVVENLLRHIQRHRLHPDDNDYFLVSSSEPRRRESKAQIHNDSDELEHPSTCSHNAGLVSQSSHTNLEAMREQSRKIRTQSFVFMFAETWSSRTAKPWVKGM